MQISALKKLLQLISPSESPSEEKPSAATSEQEAENKMQEEFEILNSEFEIDSADEEDLEIRNLKSEIDTDRESEEEQISAPESNRAHLTSSVPRAASVPAGVMTKAELREIRELFNNMDDAEIQRLYKKVTKNN